MTTATEIQIQASDFQMRVMLPLLEGYQRAHYEYARLAFFLCRLHYMERQALDEIEQMVYAAKVNLGLIVPKF